MSGLFCWTFANYCLILKVEYTYPKNMNLSKIKNDLQQVLQLVEDWHAKGVDELERDIALGKLREIYSEVRFDAAPQPETITSEAEDAPCEQDEKSLNESSQPEVEQMPIGVAISLDDVFEGFIPEELMPAIVEETLESESEEEAIAESDEVEDEVEIEIEIYIYIEI